MPDLPIPLPIVIVAGLLGGVLLTILLARRTEWATVTEADPAARPVDPERGYGWGDLLLHLSDQEELAAEFPELRQAFADEVMSSLSPWRGDTAWRYAVWALLRRHLSADTPGFWPDLDLDCEGRPVHVLLDLSGCRIRHANFRRAQFPDRTPGSPAPSSPAT